MRIILTLSCAWFLMPTWPCSLDSSSAMRCSSLETVLWRSETAESVIGAIMWICGQSAGGRYVVIRGRRDGRRGGAQWQVQEMSTRVDSFGVGSLRARLDGCTDSRAAVSVPNDWLGLERLGIGTADFWTSTSSPVTILVDSA